MVLASDIARLQPKPEYRTVWLLVVKNEIVKLWLTSNIDINLSQTKAGCSEGSKTASPDYYEWKAQNKIKF